MFLSNVRSVNRVEGQRHDQTKLIIVKLKNKSIFTSDNNHVTSQHSVHFRSTFPHNFLSGSKFVLEGLGSPEGQRRQV